VVENASLLYIYSSVMNFINILEVMSKVLQNVVDRGNLDKMVTLISLMKIVFLKTLLD